jgi:uncharacterized protein (DUF885 family)
MPGPDVPLEAIPLHPLAPGASPEERDFARLEQEVLHHIFRLETWWAIFRGLHIYDGQLAIVEPSDTRAWCEETRRILRKLEGVDKRSLPQGRQIDLFTLQLRLEGGLFYQEDFPTPDLSTFDYLFPVQLTEFISREYAPASQRAEAVVRQLRSTPAFLRAGMARLKGPLPRPFVTLGLDILKELPQHFKEGVSWVAEASPPLLPDAKRSTESVLLALEDFRAHLERELPRSDNSFVLGPNRFQKLLWINDGLTLSWETLHQEGQADLRRNQVRLEAIAKAMQPPRSTEEAVQSLAEDTPTADHLLDEARRFVIELRDFVVDKQLASLPDDVPCRVEESPPADRAFAFASMRSAGPFEEGATEAAYRITLPDPSADPEKQRQWLRSLNRPLLRNCTAHEVYPGHYLQFQHFRWTSASPTQKAFPSGTFSEGWGHYAEQLVVEHGFGGTDPRQEIAQLQDALLRDCRLLASVAMHAQSATLQEATQIFVREAHVEAFPAEREARRGTFNPSYFMYTLGKLRILDARRAYFERHPKGTLRQFHDRILAHGAPPVGTLPALALDETPA